MTYPPCSVQGVSSAHPPTSEWSSVTIIRSTDTRFCSEEIDEDNEDDDEEEQGQGSHDSLCRSLLSKTHVTMTSLTIGCHGDAGGRTMVGCHGDGGLTTVGCHGNDGVQLRVESTSSSLSPPRLNHSLSASEGVNFLTGSEIGGGGGRKVEEQQVQQRRGDVFLSAPETTAGRDCKDRVVGVQGGGSQGGMTKLQKFFEPLRRSRSTGNTKEETRKVEEPAPRYQHQQQQQQQVSGFGSYFFRSNSRKASFIIVTI